MLKVSLTSAKTQKNAELVVLRVDPTKCTVEGSRMKVAEVCKPALFTLCTVYQNGQICREKQVKLKSRVNHSVTHTKVTSNESGVHEWRVEFMRSLTLQRFMGGTP